MQTSGAIFFDVDGVILDSLPPHLQICRDKAKAFGLSIEIPSEDMFKAKLMSGQKISPMFYFFTSVGFPSDLAKIAAAEYEEEFSTVYKIEVFKNYKLTIETLRKYGWTLGIVTSNVEANIFPALGKSIDNFDPRCIFTHDNTYGKSKACCLSEGARRLAISPSECYYIGDLPADVTAASKAGFNFIGATYGWGLRREGNSFPTVDSIDEIPEKVRFRRL